ncbi:MAG: Gfo/Idh/MocA family oxidoreductase [Pseudomonadota bacterium]
MPDKQPQIAVIGCGHWGKNLVRNFAELGALTAVCDHNESLAQNLSKKHNVPMLTSEQILSTPDIKGIVIAAPAIHHAALATQALDTGKHVFVEKPLAVSVEDAQMLCELAQSKNLTLMVGHLLQYHPAFLQLKQMVDNGTLGKLQYLYSNRLNLGKFRNEENILWSFAPHDISMILALTGEMPEKIFATGARHINPTIEDSTTTHMHFASGVQAHIFVSWLHPFKEQKLVVVGDKGMAVFDDGQEWGQKLKIYPHQVNWIKGVPTPEKAEVTPVPLEVSEPLKLECQHFLDCIETGKQPRTDGPEGLNVLRVLDAAQKSIRTGAYVAMDERDPTYFQHETAIIDANCSIGKGSKIWHFSHVMRGACVGDNCVIGQNVMIGAEVVVGNNCKIQNNVSIYKGITLEDGVFCGPSCVFTNVMTPRAEVERKDEFLPTHVEKGVTIGANATILCGVRLGAYSMIGAGAVVTKDVKPQALVVGNPARQVGWVSHAGEKLGDDLVCPREGRRYVVDGNNSLREKIEKEAYVQKTA